MPDDIKKQSRSDMAYLVCGKISKAKVGNQRFGGRKITQKKEGRGKREQERSKIPCSQKRKMDAQSACAAYCRKNFVIKVYFPLTPHYIQTKEDISETSHISSHLKEHHLIEVAAMIS